MKKRTNFFLVSFISFFFLLLPQPVFAHSGGGPPFLTINGKFAQTNPYFQETRTELQIPLDISPESYLINEPIVFAVDLEQMKKQTTIAPETVKDITFRWSFSSGDNFSEEQSEYFSGSSLTHTFTKAKSYLLRLEGKSTFDDEYILLDSVQLNVAPTLDYQLPGLSIFIGVDGSAIQKPVIFVSRSTVDASTNSKSYLWDFGDGKLLKDLYVQQTFEKKPQYVTEYIYHRVIDGNGFSTDIGFLAEHFEGDIHFLHFNSMRTSPFTIGTYEQARKLVSIDQKMPPVVIAWIVIMGSGLLLIIIFFVLVARQKKKK